MTLANETRSVTDDACGHSQAIRPQSRNATRQSLGRPRVTSISLICAVFIYLCSVGEVQPQPKIPLLAYFSPGSGPDAPSIKAFREGLKDVGLTVGTDIMIDHYNGYRKLDTFPEIAKGIVASKPDVIAASSTPVIKALMRETKDIPIVITAAGDPVGSGLVSSLARPGGNVTGVSMRSPQVTGKRLELIKDLLPSARRIVIFWNPTNSSHSPTLTDSRATARALNLELLSFAVEKRSDLETAFKSFLAMKADAFTLIRDSFFLLHRKQFVIFARNNKIPAVYDGWDFVLEEGGLISYAAHHRDLHRRAAIYVKKILKRANPADLPVEQTMRSEFVINLKAAKEIGLTIPPEMLVLADQVIE